VDYCASHLDDPDAVFNEPLGDASSSDLPFWLGLPFVSWCLPLFFGLAFVCQIFQWAFR
jgi:hypothetical protein